MSQCITCADRWVHIEWLQACKKMDEMEIVALREEVKKLKYELHIARSSAILLKHSLDGGYD